VWRDPFVLFFFHPPVHPLPLERLCVCTASGRVRRLVISLIDLFFGWCLGPQGRSAKGEGLQESSSFNSHIPAAFRASFDRFFPFFEPFRRPFTAAEWKKLAAVHAALSRSFFISLRPIPRLDAGHPTAR